MPPRGYPRVTLQLFVMDDDGSNVEQIGYINIACALHPVILRDGRLIFSTLESQGIHNSIMWGIWSIHPDGTNWGPVISAFETGGAPSGYHFQTQLSDGTIVIEKYYNQNQKGFGTLFKLPEKSPEGVSAFGPGDLNDPRNQVSFADVDGKERGHVVPFSADGMKLITPWIVWDDRPVVSADSEDDEIAADRQGDASLRRAEQSSAGGLDAGSDRRLLRRGARFHGPQAHGLRHLPDQGRQGQPASPATCCSSRTTRTTTSNGRGRWCRTNASTA